MRFQTPLVPARLIRRYKRFLADCELADGRQVTAHCANPGSMQGLARPGTDIWLEPNDDPRRKLKFGWRLVDHGNGNFTGIDTSVPNRLLARALADARVPELRDYRTQRAEVKYGRGSRVDFLLTQPGLPDAYVEIKSVTLSRRQGLAEFPDSVTARGTRHLHELAAMAARGNRAVMLYLIQRNDCTEFAVAGDIDPAYAAACRAAREQGVETLVYTTHISVEAIELARAL